MNTASILSAPIVVLGNADGPSLPCARESTWFTFNGRQAPCSGGMRIDLKMIQGEGGAPWVRAQEGLPKGLADDLELVLNFGLAELCQSLGCWPSTGYAAIHALWSLARDVTVQRIAFDPSLARSAFLHARKPLPQAYHNWLGERRTTFSRWLIEPCRGWSWRLVVDDACSVDGNAQSTAANVTVAELLDVFNAARKTGATAGIKAISAMDVHPGTALLGASAEIQLLEQCFHLDRRQVGTRNWWLYDAEASIHVEQIATRLRFAQWQCFVRMAGSLQSEHGLAQ